MTAPSSRTGATDREVEGQHVCPRCGSPEWVSVSLDEGWTRLAQCVPCGRIHAALGPGWRREHYERGQRIAAENEARAALLAEQPGGGKQRDERPHSRACGWRLHDHGSACSTNCPTCGGKP